MLDAKSGEKRLQKFAGLCQQKGLDLTVIADWKNVYRFISILRQAWPEWDQAQNL
jgi:hypothetical protein